MNIIYLTPSTVYVNRTSRAYINKYFIQCETDWPRKRVISDMFVFVDDWQLGTG